MANTGETTPRANRPPVPHFPVVGIGASAGGLDPMSEFLAAVPADTDAAFLIVSHQHPDYVSLLPELLERHSALPVVEITEGMQLAPGRVYVAPPGARLALMENSLRLFLRDPSVPLGLPIDFFFRSLANDAGDRAVAVVLSGTGTDGTVGAKTVKAEGGLVVVQDPDSADHEGMPRSVINAGVADYVARPADMPAQILAYCEQVHAPPTQPKTRIPDTALQRLLRRLRERTGRDFSAYKSSTIRRRTERRMGIRHVRDVTDYLQFVDANPHELDLLFKDLLIGVTSFFRDHDVWQALADKALRPLLQGRSPEQTVRVWVPGCSTGEEAYTIAILLTELIDEVDARIPLQVFATDLDSHAIDTARAGLYPAGIAADVSPDRLDRFFFPQDQGYRIRAEIRDRIIFAPHDLLTDPPFTRIDLVSCRNVLIYMETALQERILPLFHYSLEPGGVLLLGTSETIGRFSGMFEAIDARSRIFRRIGESPRPIRNVGARSSGGEPEAAGRLRRPHTIAETAERALVSHYVPPSIVVNEQGDILHIHGRTGQYLEPAPGRPSHNAFAMARPGLQLALSSAVRRALAQRAAVVQRGVEVRTNGGFSRVTVSAEPLDAPDPARGLVLVTFELEPPRTKASEGEATENGDKHVEELEEEVQRSREHLQRTIEELEGSDEELQSMNEELQSANEELETAKEEMHSLNEELQTVNSELEQKVFALSEVNDDMTNLLNSTEIATIFLDRDLNVKRFTRPARNLIHLIDSDIGRPIGDLAADLRYDSLVADASEVLRTLVPFEHEVKANDGRDYLMRILPYRTRENVIDGLVVTFIDTTELQAARSRILKLASNVVDAMPQPLLVLDAALIVVFANPAFCEQFHVRGSACIGVPLAELNDGAWDVDELRRELADVLARNANLEGFRLDAAFPQLGEQHLLLNARRLRGAEDDMILVSMLPIEAS